MSFNKPHGIENRRTPENKIKEGVDFVFEQNPGLRDIGTKEQYSEYLDTIFPESKIKDIAYHGSTSDESFEKFKSPPDALQHLKDVFYFCLDKDEIKKFENEGKEYKKIITTVLNIQSPLYVNHQLSLQSVFEPGLMDVRYYPNEALIKIFRIRDSFLVIPFGEVEERFENPSKEILLKYLPVRKFNTEEEALVFTGNNKIGDYDHVYGEEYHENYYVIFASKEEQVESLKKRDDVFYLQKIVAKELRNYYDSIIQNEGYVTLETEGSQIAILNPEQIHILGSRQDLEKFKKFVAEQQ